MLNAPQLFIPAAITQDMDHFELRDCESCQGLCCTALMWEKDEDFADEKMPGFACKNLDLEKDKEDAVYEYRCKIYGKRTENGYAGCSKYSCYGAGQIFSDFLKYLDIELAEEPGINERLLTRRMNNITSAFAIVQQFAFRSLVQDVQNGVSEPVMEARRKAMNKVLAELEDELTSYIGDPKYRIDFDDWEAKFWDARHTSDAEFDILDKYDSLVHLPIIEA